MGVIVIHGAPGNGKSTVAKELHARWGCPWFEFGWIPEFTKLNPHTDITQALEEQISFENVVLVSKNYRKHGFEHVLLTDLNDARMLDIPVYFREDAYLIFTLYAEDDAVLKQRILLRENGNSYKDYEEAIAINQLVKRRRLLPNEYRLCSDVQTPVQIADQIQMMIAQHVHNPDFRATEHNPADYFSYIRGYSWEEPD